MIVLLAFFVLLFVPGTLLALAGRMSAVTAIAFAPVLLAALVTLATFALPASLLQGTTWIVVVWVAAAVMAGAGLALLIRRRNLKIPPRDEWWALGGALTASVIWVWQVSAHMRPMDTILQRRDAVFHVNLMAGARDGWGSLSPFGASGWMLGTPDSAAFYPTTFYGIGNAVPGSVVVAANCLTITLIVAWCFGLAALTRAVVPKLPAAWGIAPVLSLMAISFPLITFYRHGQWPFGLAVALLPAVLAVLIHTLRDRWGWFGWILVLAGLIGLGGAQPGGAIAAVVVIALAGVVSLFWRGRGWMNRWVALGLALSIPLAYVAALNLPKLVQMGNFDRIAQNVFTLLGDVLTFGHTNAWEDFPITPSLFLSVVALYGFVVLSTVLAGRLMVASTLAFVIFLVATSASPTWLRILGAPWYRDSERLQAILVIFTIVAAAVGIAHLASLLASRMPKAAGLVAAPLLAVLVCLPTAGDRAAIRDMLVEENYYPDARNKEMELGPVWTMEDRVFFAGLAEPVDGTVMADPASGGILLPAALGIRSFPAVSSLDQVSPLALDVFWALREGSTLTAEECRFIETNNIRYIYTDRTKGSRFGHSYWVKGQFAGRFDEVPLRSDVDRNEIEERALFRVPQCKE